MHRREKCFLATNYRMYLRELRRCGFQISASMYLLASGRLA